MWLLEPESSETLSDNPVDLPYHRWSNKNFALNWEKLFETTVCYAEKAKTLTSFLETMAMSRNILLKVLHNRDVHKLSGPLKTLSVFAAELISYLPGSAKGGIQYPGPLMKIMRSPGILSPTEPLHIVGSKETDTVNLQLFPRLEGWEKDHFGVWYESRIAVYAWSHSGENFCSAPRYTSK